MPFGEGYRPKSPEELSRQFETAQESLGSDAEHSLVPESQDQEKILQMSESELKQKFARRYEMYLQLLRDQKRREKTGGGNLSPEEIEQIKKWLAVLNSLDEYIKKHHEGEEVTLRGKQIDVFGDLRNFLEEGGMEGYVKLPTGVGKTVLFTELIESMDIKTLVVVPGRLLAEQTGAKMEEFAPDIEVGKIHAYAKQHGRQVTIITYNSLIKQLENGALNPEDFDLLILDEVHRSLSKQRRDAVGKFKDSIKIGFTATPNFSHEKTVANLLLKKEIHSMTIREAVEEGMLCSVSSLVVKTETDISKVKIDDKGDYDKKELEQAINISARNKVAVDIYKQEYDGQLAVAYCIGVRHAEAVAGEFNRQGISAASISGATPKKEQDRILKQFHNKEIKVLCNADLLIEGFDEKQASVCLNLRPTRSRVLAEQRGGRVLRFDEKNEEKHATVVDFLDKGYEDGRRPVIFADVADGASFYPKKKKRKGGGGLRDGRRMPLIFDVPGVDIIYEDEEIMKIVGKNREGEEKNKKIEKINDYGILKAAVQAAVAAGEIEVDVLNLKGTYLKLITNHPGWIKAPYNRPDFVSFSDLFGKKRVSNYVDLKAAVQAAVAAGEIKVDVRNLKKMYIALHEKHPEWIVYPPSLDGFISYEDLFGKKIISNYVDLKAAVQAAVAAGEAVVDIRSLGKTYAKLREKHSDWIKEARTANGFINYEDLFGVKIISTYDDFKAAVQAAVAAGEAVVDIRSLEKTYAILKTKHPGWVKKADGFKGFISYRDLFGLN